MRSQVRNYSRNRVAAPTATFKVKFGRNGDCMGNGKVVPSGRTPRVTRLLALAHRIDGMIRSGELRDWAEAARMIGITRARMTQIANLLLLPPEIQEAILSLPPIAQGQAPFTEHTLRSIVVYTDWDRQNSTWESLRPCSVKFL